MQRVGGCGQKEFSRVWPCSGWEGVVMQIVGGCSHAEGGSYWECLLIKLRNKDPCYGDAPVEHVFCHRSFGEKGAWLKESKRLFSLPRIVSADCMGPSSRMWNVECGSPHCWEVHLWLSCGSLVTHLWSTCGSPVSLCSRLKTMQRCASEKCEADWNRRCVAVCLRLTCSFVNFPKNPKCVHTTDWLTDLMLGILSLHWFKVGHLFSF